MVAHGSTDRRLTWIQQLPALSCEKLCPLDWSTQQEVHAKPLDCMLCCLQSTISSTSFKSSLFRLPDWGILSVPLLRPSYPNGTGITVRSRSWRASNNRSVDFITVSGQGELPEQGCRSLCSIPHKQWHASSWGKTKLKHCFTGWAGTRNAQCSSIH